MKENLAQMLHEATSQCAKGTQKVLAKCQKAALDGKSSIKIRCDKADHDCLHQFSFGEQMPATPLITELRSQGFHLDSDYDVGMFFNTWNLTISW